MLTESPKKASKLILRKSKYDHVTQLLQELHWLPIKFWPQYKTATFVNRFSDGSLPGYLSQTLCAYEPTRNLRSLCEKLLKVPKHNTKMFGESSFSFLAPSVCNSAIWSQKFFYPSGFQQSSAPPSPLPPCASCFSCLTIVKRERERKRECREQERWPGGGGGGGGGGAVCVHVRVRGAERELERD